MKKQKEKTDLYAMKREILKKKRQLRNSILGTDTVDGSSMQRVYGEATKTRRALKIQFFGSESKKSGTKGKDTSIEIKFKQILDDLNIEYIEQRAIRYINTDFFLSEYNLAVECNGEYWHVDPTVYPNGPKNNIQRKNIEKDKISKEIILGKGINRLVIWEKEFNDTESLKVKFKNFLRSIDKTKNIAYDSNDWK